jgi:hypothetical protein
MENGSLPGLSNDQKMPVRGIKLNDYRLPQRSVRDAVTKHNPAIRVAALSLSGEGNVNGFIAAETNRIVLMEDRQRPDAGIVALNTARAA